MEQLLAWDQALFLWLNNMGSPNFDSFWMMMTHKGSNVVVYLIVWIFLGYKTSGKQQLISLFFLEFLFYAPIN
jgi:undecaprenyl-diphosphatase